MITNRKVQEISRTESFPSHCLHSAMGVGQLIMSCGHIWGKNSLNWSIGRNPEIAMKYSKLTWVGKAFWCAANRFQQRDIINKSSLLTTQRSVRDKRFFSTKPYYSILFKIATRTIYFMNGLIRNLPNRSTKFKFPSGISLTDNSRQIVIGW